MNFSIYKKITTHLLKKKQLFTKDKKEKYAVGQLIHFIKNDTTVYVARILEINNKGTRKKYTIKILNSTEKKVIIKCREHRIYEDLSLFKPFKKHALAKVQIGEKILYTNSLSSYVTHYCYTFDFSPSIKMAKKNDPDLLIVSPGLSIIHESLALVHTLREIIINGDYIEAYAKGKRYFCAIKKPPCREAKIIPARVEINSIAIDMSQNIKFYNIQKKPLLTKSNPLIGEEAITKKYNGEIVHTDLMTDSSDEFIAAYKKIKKLTKKNC
jgi:hypothetical protein